MSGDSILSFVMFIKCLIMWYTDFTVLSNIIRSVNGFERSFVNCLKMVVGILPGPTALCTFRTLISVSTSSGNIGERKKNPSDCLGMSQRFWFLLVGFLTSFPTTELKNLLKRLKFTLSSAIVLLSIFELMFCINFLFVTLKIDLISSYTFFNRFWYILKEWLIIFLFTYSSKMVVTFL